MNNPVDFPRDFFAPNHPNPVDKIPLGEMIEVLDGEWKSPWEISELELHIHQDWISFVHKPK